MAYEPDQDPFAQEHKKGPHDIDTEKLDKIIATATETAAIFARARVRANEGYGPGANMSYASAAHLVHDLNRQLGYIYDPPRKPPTILTHPPCEDHLHFARLNAAARGGAMLRDHLTRAMALAEDGEIDAAYIYLGDAHNALNEIAKAMGFKLVWAPELVQSKTAFASAGAGGAVTGGR